MASDGHVNSLSDSKLGNTNNCHDESFPSLVLRNATIKLTGALTRILFKCTCI